MTFSVAATARRGAVWGVQPVSIIRGLAVAVRHDIGKVSGVSVMSAAPTLGQGWFGSRGNQP